MTTLFYDAVLFDLDGVLTSTAALHAVCWKRTFDDVLSAYGQEPFDIEHDYVEYVDGKMRADGVRDFLDAGPAGPAGVPSRAHGRSAAGGLDSVA